MNKKFLYAQSFMDDSFKLAEKIHNSGYIPDVVIGIWRGGSIPAIGYSRIFKLYGRAYTI